MTSARAGLSGTYLARLSQLGIEPQTLVLDERGTVALAPDREAAAPPLPLLTSARAPLLSLGPELAAGGMGIVIDGTQLALDRAVAVKTLRPEHIAFQAELVREALVTGALEHPNIVPVHALGADETGRPLLVMKRIEGVPWSRLLADPDAAGRLPSAAADLLEFHVGVLMQVCNAVHFAHSRGFVHRDIKPDNVMIGEFGEVYLLDWGLAVAVTEQATRSAPAAREVARIAGTPAYMAPEMAAADGASIGTATDVYLLGACLHEILTGKPRHDGASVVDSLSLAFESAPVSYPAQKPRELCELANRATARDPAERLEGADAFQGELAAFLRHAGSRRLEQEARRRAESLAAQLDCDAPFDSTLLHRAVADARLLFEQALAAWPNNADAKRSRRELLGRVFDYELMKGNREGAAALLADLPDDRERAQQLQQLDESLLRRAREIEALEQMRRDTQIGGFDRERRLVAFVMGSVVLLAVGTTTVLRFLGLHKSGYADAIGILVLLDVAAMVTSRLARVRELPLIQRRIRNAILYGAWSFTAVIAGCWALGVDMTAALALAMGIAGALCGIMAVMLTRALWWATAAFAAGAMAIGAWPKYRGLSLLLGNALAFWAMGAIRWKKPADAGADEPNEN